MSVEMAESQSRENVLDSREWHGVAFHRTVTHGHRSQRIKWQARLHRQGSLFLVGLLLQVVGVYSLYYRMHVSLELA